MLKKLLKYEFKSVGRLFLPLYGLTLLLAILNKMSYFIDTDSFEVPEFMLNAAYIMILVGLALVTFIQCIIRFKNNLLGDEGYLMFTLPVSRGDLTMSKLIAAVCWTIIGGCVGLISLLILMPTGGWRSFFVIIEDMIQYGDMNTVAFIIYSLVIALLSVASVYTPIYLALSLGHMSNKNRMLASFGWYFVINFVWQTLSSVGLWLFGNMGLSDYILNMMGSSGTLFSHMVFLVIIAHLLIYNGIHMMITNRVLTNKLNLE